MTALKTNRDKRGARALGLLLAVWFGLGVQPCALAAGDHLCPHCPPAEAGTGHAHHSRETASQASPHDAHAAHEHNASAGHDAHAGHDDPASSPCKSMQADCCDAGAASTNTRGADFKSKFDNTPALAIAPSFADLAPVYLPRHDRVADPPQPAGTTTRLHKLYCVYLD